MADIIKTALLLFDEQERSSESDGSARLYTLDDSMLEALGPVESILLDVETFTLSSGTARAEVEIRTTSILDRLPRHGEAIVQLLEPGQSAANKITISAPGLRRADSVGGLRARTEVLLRVFDSDATPEEVKIRLRIWATVKG